MATESLQDLLVDELKDLYSAENQILKAIPRMIKAADAPKLKQALESHANVTQQHVQRLEKITAGLGEKPRGKKCMGMEGVLEEGKEVLQEKLEPQLEDAAIIGAAQKVEHYEIASYGTARTHAQLLGLTDAVNLLQQTLDEEKQADRTLTEIAESFVNERVAGDEEADEDEEEDEDTDDEDIDDDDEEDENTIDAEEAERGVNATSLPRL